MKKVIVILATIALGIFLYNLIAGQGDSSLLHSIKGIMEWEIEQQQIGG